MKNKYLRIIISGYILLLLTNSAFGQYIYNNIPFGNSENPAYVFSSSKELINSKFEYSNFQYAKSNNYLVDIRFNLKKIKSTVGINYDNFLTGNKQAFLADSAVRPFLEHYESYTINYSYTKIISTGKLIGIGVGIGQIEKTGIKNLIDYKPNLKVNFGLKYRSRKITGGISFLSVNERDRLDGSSDKLMLINTDFKYSFGHKMESSDFGVKSRYYTAYLRAEFQNHEKISQENYYVYNYINTGFSRTYTKYTGGISYRYVFDNSDIYGVFFSYKPLSVLSFTYNFSFFIPEQRTFFIHEFSINFNIRK